MGGWFGPPEPVNYIFLFGCCPANVTLPKDCAMFALGSPWRPQTLQSKHSLVNFYTALECETDNTGLIPLKVRSLTCSSVLDSWVKKNHYTSFLQMFRQWRYLLLLKCLGQGHQDGLSTAMRLVDLAILCPACLHPSLNLQNGCDIVAPQEQ